MEPRAAVGSYENGRFTLHVGSQGVFGMRANIAQVLNVEPKQVHVLTGNVGGSFGMKAPVFAEYVCVLHAARALGRPVKWTDERSDELRFGQPRPRPSRHRRSLRSMPKAISSRCG